MNGCVYKTVLRWYRQIATEKDFRENVIHPEENINLKNEGIAQFWQRKDYDVQNLIGNSGKIRP
jgi:hypothetical protein